MLDASACQGAHTSHTFVHGDYVIEFVACFIRLPVEFTCCMCLFDENITSARMMHSFVCCSACVGHVLQCLRVSSFRRSKA